MNIHYFDLPELAEKFIDQDDYSSDELISEIYNAIKHSIVNMKFGDVICLTKEDGYKNDGYLIMGEKDGQLYPKELLYEPDDYGTTPPEFSIDRFEVTTSGELTKLISLNSGIYYLTYNKHNSYVWIRVDKINVENRTITSGEYEFNVICENDINLKDITIGLKYIFRTRDEDHVSLDGTIWLSELFSESDVKNT